MIKFFHSEEKSERKKCAIITAFAVVPIVFDFLQVFFVSVPCTSVAFQIAIIIVYAFISVERSENVLLSVSERQKSNMKTALVQAAMSWYEFNVDRDCIYDSKIYLDQDHYVECPENTDKKYSAIFTFLISRVFPKFVDLYRETFSLDNLKRRFEQGESEVSCGIGSNIVVERVDASEVENGDIISFFSQDPAHGGAMNTHRVVSIEQNGDNWSFVTKGDANQLEDKYVTSSEDLIGKVVFVSHGMGIIVHLLSNPLIFIPVIVLPMFVMLIYNLSRTIRLTRNIVKEEEEAAVREAVEAIRKSREE